MGTEQFEQWAILELMGRTKLAGFVREKTVAGAGFLHITIPSTTRQPEFSRLISPQSLFAINPVDEQTARVAAERFNEAPIQAWEIDSYINKAKQLAQNTVSSPAQLEEEEFEREEEEEEERGHYDDYRNG